MNCPMVRVHLPSSECLTHSHPTSRVNMVLDTDNLHFSDEFLDFPLQADVDTMWMRSDLPHDSTVIFCTIPHERNLGWNSTRIRAENGKTQQLCMYSFVQYLYVHSQHTSFISSVK